MILDTVQRKNYREVITLKTSSGLLSAWQSTKAIDQPWDDFLAASPFGHFYQTSLWAEVRKLDGWEPLIAVVTHNDDIVGGFQILWRSKNRLGKIGLVLKGPVISSEDPAVINFVISTLKFIVKTNHIRALIGQAPDGDIKTPDVLWQSDFSILDLDHSIKDNTVVMDLTQDEEALFRAMKHNKRKNIKTARRKGIYVREGVRDDLNTFFDYMTQTCRRQNVGPSPSDIQFIKKMWDLFSIHRSIKLFLSGCQDRDLSALLVVLFGQTAYLWKFGWSGASSQCRPNEILYFEIFKWARENHYRFADMGAIDSEIAHKIWNHEPIPEAMSHSYSFFKAGFGGLIQRLSKGFIYIPNPAIRLGYHLLMPLINTRPSLKKRLLFGET